MEGEALAACRVTGNMNCFVLRLGFARVAPLYLQYCDLFQV